MANTASPIKLLLQAVVVLSCAHAAVGAMLLDRHMHLAEVMSTAAVPPAHGQQACAELANRGTYFTVDVEVGTPGQRFSVVADTGSNTLIVPSCICQQAGYCSTEDRCFIGTNKSTSFTLMKEGKEPVSMILSFGSGMIRGVLAKEEVKVGGAEVYMKNGLMLMTGKALNFAGSFEGILGLGIPAEGHKHSGHRSQQRSGGASGAAKQADAYSDAGSMGQQDVSKIIDWLKNIMNGGASGEQASSAQVANSSASADVWEDGQPLPGIAGVAGPDVQREQPPGFLEQAGIKRFDICFNEGQSGVLRLGTPSNNTMTQHGSVGTMHWGLGMSGISVAGTGTGGSRTATAARRKMANLALCNSSDMLPGQETACGAIPDSGTTLITGPAEGVSLLLDSVCEYWPRCKSNYTALLKAKDAAEKAAAEKYGFTPFKLPKWPMSKVLELLLMDCESWLDESSGLAELPSLHFHVTGSTGTRQTLDMPPHAYVMESSVAHLKDKLKRNKSSASASSLHGLQQPYSEDPYSGYGAAESESSQDAWLESRNKVCSPAFSVLDYNTERNGPVWILGTPFFYEYNVGYDLSTKPPSVSLQSTKQTPCGSCNGKVGLVASGAARDRTGSSARHRQPLRIHGVPRKPSFDLDEPL